MSRKILIHRRYFRRVLPHFQPDRSILFVSTNVQRPHFTRPRLRSLGIHNAAGVLVFGKIPCLLQEELHKHDGELYTLHAYAIMPDHLHMLIEPARRTTNDVPLSLIMHVLKRTSAFLINKELGRTGQFWQREFYDSVIRSKKHFDRVVEYIRRNPVAEGLVDEADNWPWLYVRQRPEA